MALAVADAVAARVEGGERGDQHLGEDLRGLGAGAIGAEAHGDEVGATDEFAEDHRAFAVREGGQREARAGKAQPVHQRADIDLRLDRQEARHDPAGDGDQVEREGLGEDEGGLDPGGGVEGIAPREGGRAQVGLGGSGHGGGVAERSRGVTVAVTVAMARGMPHPHPPRAARREGDFDVTVLPDGLGLTPPSPRRSRRNGPPPLAHEGRVRAGHERPRWRHAAAGSDPPSPSCPG